MAANGRLRVVLGLTGEEAADRDALAIRDAPAPALVTANPPPPARAQTRALPDAEEEARYAVRRIFAQLAQRPAAWTASPSLTGSPSRTPGSSPSSSPPGRGRHLGPGRGAGGRYPGRGGAADRGTQAQTARA
jgi:hypothetical protein